MKKLIVPIALIGSMLLMFACGNNSNKATEKDGKVVWHNKDKSKEYNFYSGTDEDGIDFMEYEVILNEKPNTNVIEFDIDIKNLDCSYQPELTQEEIDEGAFRPDNIIGSYACYHKTKSGHIIGQTNYMSGKAFHIYRPQMIDSVGNKEWGILEIKGNKLTVEIPQEFLDNAFYPIKHATGFKTGYETLGGTGIRFAGKHLTGTALCDQKGRYYNFGDAGNLDKITVGLSSEDATETVDTYVGIWREDSAGANSHNLVASVERANLSLTNTETWYDFTASSEELSVDDYILGIVGNGEDMDASNDDVWILYDSTDNIRIYSKQTTGAGCYATRKAEEPWTEVETTSASEYSIYATYTASASDTCTAPATGDWYVHSSDNCYISADTYVNGEIHLLNRGEGKLHIIDGATLAASAINSTSTDIDVEAGSFIKLWNAQ